MQYVLRNNLHGSVFLKPCRNKSLAQHLNILDHIIDPTYNSEEFCFCGMSLKIDTNYQNWNLAIYVYVVRNDFEMYSEICEHAWCDNNEDQ